MKKKIIIITVVVKEKGAVGEDGGKKKNGIAIVCETRRYGDTQCALHLWHMGRIVLVMISNRRPLYRADNVNDMTYTHVCVASRSSGT